MRREYRVLKKQIFSIGDFQIVPIRNKDQLDIMKWRNDQIYHLRQNKPLTEDDQRHYFTNIISKLFSQDQPSQILFSYLEDGKCIGYGGLVHINWVDKNAEISFIMDTKLEMDNFEKHWSIFLNLIEEVAFSELNFYKIYTYAFDLRPMLYTALVKKQFDEVVRLKKHAKFGNQYVDVVIHSKFNEEHKF